MKPSRLLSLVMLLTLSTSSTLLAQKKSKDKKKSGTVDNAAAAQSIQDPQVTALATTIYGGMIIGQVDASLVTPDLGQKLNAAMSSENQLQFKKLGALQSLELERKEPTQFVTKYVYMATFANAQKRITMLIGPDGKVMDYMVTK